MVINEDETEHKVRVVISCGLICLAACVAVAVVVGNRIAPRIEQQFGITPMETPRTNGVSYDTFKNAPLNSIPINEEASREIKKGGQQAPKQDPSVMSVPTNQRCSVALFVSTDSQSQSLLDWFNNDKYVVEFKKKCNFQAYTRDNALYKSRYANLIPADQFPAVVFTAPDGGHIYVAARSQLPGSASQLMQAMQAAFEVANKARAQRPANDEAPALEVNAPDCPDGSCTPADREPFFTPESDGARKPLFPFLREPDKPTIESLFYWLWNPGEAILAVCCTALFLLILLVVLVKVMRS